MVTYLVIQDAPYYALLLPELDLTVLSEPCERPRGGTDHIQPSEVDQPALPSSLYQRCWLPGRRTTILDLPPHEQLAASKLLVHVHVIQFVPKHRREGPHKRRGGARCGRWQCGRRIRDVPSKRMHLQQRGEQTHEPRARHELQKIWIGEREREVLLRTGCDVDTDIFQARRMVKVEARGTVVDAVDTEEAVAEEACVILDPGEIGAAELA